MLNSLELVGSIKSINLNCINLEVKRSYYDDNYTPIYDLFTIYQWNTSQKNFFNSLRENDVITIRGRLEKSNDEITIIAEHIQKVLL
jgi:hypothetical protein